MHTKNSFYPSGQMPVQIHVILLTLGMPMPTGNTVLNLTSIPECNNTPVIPLLPFRLKLAPNELLFTNRPHHHQEVHIAVPLLNLFHIVFAS